MTSMLQVEWKEGKAKFSLGLFLLIGLALTIAGGNIGCRSSSRAADGDDKESLLSPVKGVMHLEAFVVNLADPEENRFLRVGIDLGLENPLPAREGKGGGVPTARIRDCILTVLSTWRSDALLAPDGKQKLKEQLLQALRDRTPELGVKEIYFTDFLVQR